jgi:O-methyltransferase
MSEPNPPELCPNVIFATPTLSHSFSAHFMRSMQETLWMCAANGITTGCMVRPGDCFVDKARNKLVSDFLREFPGTENFFFLDDDIGWPPEKAIEFIRRPDPIVAGVYPKKSEEIDWPCTFALDKDKGDLIESQGLILATMIPTGFMRVKRHVLEKLCFESAVFTDQAPDGDLQEFFYLFESGRGGDGKFWGEDYTFCRKAQAAGYYLWVDPAITFKHMGLRTWENRILDHLPKFRERAKAIAEGRYDAETGKVREDPRHEAHEKIRKLWDRRSVSSAELLTDPEERAEFADIDTDFWPLYDECREETMTPIARLYDLYKTVEYIVQAGIPGAIVECGVWRGGSMMMIAKALTKFGDTGRTLQLFDTFEGLPYPDDIDVDVFDITAKAQWKPEMAKGARSVVEANMAATGYLTVTYHEGRVEDTLANEALEQYALVRLDTDWYASTKVELEVLWDRIVPGGVLILDDYGHWKGCGQAVDEFFADKAVKMNRVDYSCRTIQKPYAAPSIMLEAAQ